MRGVLLVCECRVNQNHHIAETLALHQPTPMWSATRTVYLQALANINSVLVNWMYTIPFIIGPGDNRALTSIRLNDVDRWTVGEPLSFVNNMLPFVISVYGGPPSVTTAVVELTSRRTVSC